MWGFGSNNLARSLGLQNNNDNNNNNNNNKTPRNGNPGSSGDCSDDEVSSCGSHEEGLECPICWEFFNIVENVPYVLWCGHTMCKNCILGLQWAVIKLPTVPIQLPFFISCPWCSLLCFRLIYKDNLSFPRKNYFLLWMVEGMNGDRATKTRPSASSSRSVEHHTGGSMYPNLVRRGQRGLHGETSPSLGVDDRRRVWNLFSVERVQASLRKSLAFLVHLTAKFPLIFIFLLIVLYAIPASAAVLALYLLVTVLFALPSFLILYFAYPSLDWLLREIFG
ncbi:hypothetical protein LUZ61_001648 [Rhynchospora tenuis]|uniref:RING-type domain-containing protein n=1 Tax=Rhynchospora tenuis TaxID=198213 RepID=A0AAD5ZHK8_9POAL|nr:hypothetical protein LUZ61_001648 [Rhynchospora tenuis]